MISDKLLAEQLERHRAAQSLMRRSDHLEARGKRLSRRGGTCGDLDTQARAYHLAARCYAKVRELRDRAMVTVFPNAEIPELVR